MEKYEDKDICKECGGFCCIKSGCDYFVSDFDNINIDTIETILNQGYASIVAYLDIKRLNNGNLFINPILYLRARNINREAIDLFSFKTTCMSLGKDGCKFDLENRPSGGATLIPQRDMKCYSKVDRINELNKWLPYQKLLHRIVKRQTGMTVNARLKEDVKKLFKDIIEENFEGVSKLELYDIKTMLLFLMEFYSDEFKEVFKNKPKSLLKNNIMFKNIL